MDPISLIVLVVVVGVASIFVNRRWLARQPDAGEAAVVTSAKERAAALFSQTSSQAQALGSQAADRVKSAGSQVSGQAQALGSQAADRVKSAGSQVSGQAQALGSQAADRVKSAGSQVSGQAQALGSQAAGRAQSWRQRIPFGKPKPSLAADFRVWLAEATAGEADLRDWLAGLRDDQFADFTDNVAGFCTSTGFELAWLVRAEFSLMPLLAENGGQVVVNYCRACLQAATAQAGLQSFRAYQEYTQNPGSRQGRVYGEKLLDRLLEAGLTTVSLSDFLGAAPKAKQQQVLQAIQSAAQKDPAAFHRVLGLVNQ